MSANTIAKPYPPVEAAPKRRRSLTPGSIFKHGVLLLAVFFALSPGYFMITAALKSDDEFRVNKLAPPQTIVFEHFESALIDNPIFLWMFNSAVLSFGSVLVSTTIAALAAFAIARMEFKGRDLLLALSTSLMVVPPVVMIVPLFLLFTQLDLISTYHGTILIYAGLITPFSVYLLVSFFRAIPGEIMEAALIDGATPLGILWRVVLPLSGPALVTLLVVNALYVWNDLLISLIFLPQDDMRTLMVGISVFQGRYNNQIPLTMAGMIIASLPMIILYIAFQRYFIRGLVAGAIK